MKNKKISIDKSPQKMSEIISEYAGKYVMEGDENASHEQRQGFLNIACIAWNIALLPTVHRANVVLEFINNYRESNKKTTNDNDVSALKNDIEALIKWKDERFNSVNKIIVAAELLKTNESYSLRITSTDHSVSDAAIMKNSQGYSKFRVQ